MFYFREGMLEFFADEEKLDKDRFLRRSEKKIKVCPNEQRGSKLICNEGVQNLFVCLQYPRLNNISESHLSGNGELKKRDF